MRAAYLLFALLSFGLSLSAPAAPPAQPSALGGQDSGGGNGYEAEFKLVAQQLDQEIHNAGLSADQLGFDLGKLDAAVAKAKPLATKADLSLKPGEPRNALNSKEEMIILFNQTIWTLMEPKQKRLIVMHEYCRFLGVDDSEYDVSTGITPG
jgi:hypothetical protein